jgi:thiol-disulfide isomerase/thioredoxin
LKFIWGQSKNISGFCYAPDFNQKDDTMSLPIRHLKFVTTFAAFLLVTGLHAGELRSLPPGLKAELNLTDLDGRERTLTEFRGQVVLLSFWATWCMPCLQEMPSIQHLEQLMSGQPFEVATINVGEAENKVLATVKRLQLDFPVLLDRDKSEFNKWGIEILPANFVIDATGNVRYAAIGPVKWDDDDVVEKLKALTAVTGGQQQLSP